MPRKSQAAKRPHDAPSFVVLDASAAKAKLKAKGDPKDAISQKMLSFIDRQLNEIYSAFAVAGGLPLARFGQMYLGCIH